jgi:hypothetical protein
MLARFRPRFPSHATVVAYLALFVALGGGAFALTKGFVWSDGQIHACVTKKNGQLRLVKQGKPCKTGERAIAWNKRPPSLPPPGRDHNVGAPGEPKFQNGCHNAGPPFADVGFFKDREGVVHLKGFFTGCNSPTQTVFQLPPGYRPVRGRGLGFACYQCQVGATIVGTDYVPDNPSYDGAVDIDSATAGNLDGISFRAGS